MSPKQQGVKGTTVALHMLAAVLFMGGTTYAVLSGHLRLHPDAKQLKLSTYNAKLEFVLKYQVPGLFILIVTIYNVIRCRVTTAARDPLSGNETYTQKAKNILANTLEQYLVHLVSQLILAAYVDGLVLIKVVPLLALFFFVGRVTFLLGYPNKRMFGFLVTMWPPLAAFGYCAYKFLIMVGVLV